ncbi:MAG: FkbM family methyltransferase [Deltaproteobacteria bacterium]
MRHGNTRNALHCLDIEGAEMPALLGAKELIERCLPVIQIEDKGLSRKFGYEKGDAEAWLAMEFGYVVRARPGRDVILSVDV